MTGRSGQMRQTTTAEVRLDEGNAASFGTARRATRRFDCQRGGLRGNFAAGRLDETENRTQQIGSPKNVGLSHQLGSPECSNLLPGSGEARQVRVPRAAAAGLSLNGTSKRPTNRLPI